jgi:hypothetical protein
MTHVVTMQRFEVWYFKCPAGNVFLAYYYPHTQKWEIV